MLQDARQHRRGQVLLLLFFHLMIYPWTLLLAGEWMRGTLGCVSCGLVKLNPLLKGGKRLGECQAKVTRVLRTISHNNSYCCAAPKSPVDAAGQLV